MTIAMCGMRANHEAGSGEFRLSLNACLVRLSSAELPGFNGCLMHLRFW